MQKLTDLADYIARYNMLGRLKLTTLKIAIIQNKDHAHIAQEILTKMDCIQTQSFGNLIGMGGYKHYRTNSLKNVEVHLIDSLYGEEAFEDRQFIRRKKHLETFRTNKEIIMVHLSGKKQFNEQAIDKSEILQLKRVDLSIKKDIFWKGNFKLLFQEIIKTWQAMNRCQLICCLEDSKIIAKELAKDEKRQNQWLQLSNQLNDPTAHVLKLHYKTSHYLVSSFQGFYSPESHHFVNNYSIHWQIMDILEDLWKQQGQRINYQLQKMPLSYIQDILRMNDYNTIGGFLPQSCFLKIFKPILEQTSQKIFNCLQATKFKIMHNFQMVYEYYFTKTSIKDELILRETNQIQRICNHFLEQIENAINSQISYVYAPSSIFWEMRSIKSQLYGPEQQANIEIKYIGKVYVKRVFESIRQSVPRYIGQGLLRKISRYISEQSLQNLFDVLKEVPFKIMLSQQQKETIVHKKAQRMECQKIIKFLSLKVSSTYLLKNVQEKMERSWRQMYKHSADEQERVLSQKIAQNSQTQGFFKRMKRFFTGNKQQPTKIRSKSIEKNEAQTTIQILDTNEKIKSQPVVPEKTWILVLYGNKKLDDMKVILASCEGFPQKLRNSIWFWICSRRNEDQVPHKLLDLLNKKQMDLQIQIQIKKDLGRTPPRQLFKKKYRDSLRRVLSAYSLIDQQIKYTQGMNFVVSVIISTLVHYGIKDDYLSQSSQKINLDDMQQKAFIIFHYLMVRRGFRRLMFVQREYIAQICFKLQQRIRELNEKVVMMIQQSGFTCEIIFGPLIISGLFTWSSNNEIKKRIFDLVLCRGIDILYQIVAGVTVMCEKELMKYKSEMVYDFLRNKALDVFYSNYGQSGLTNLFNSF